MPRCGDCEHFREPDSKYGKGECTWYNSEYYPEENSCSHFKAGSSANCGSCEYFKAPDSRYSKGTCSYYDRDYYPDESACSHFSKSSGSSGGCYLTTACCEFKGLPDDCYELTVMRNFRDTYLKAQPYGEALIKHYYEDAPALVKYIDNHSSRTAIYQDIYTKVQEIVKLVETSENEKAIIQYMYMVHNLYRDMLHKEVRSCWHD